MDQARRVNPVFYTNAKRLADIRGDTEGPIWLADAQHGSRLAVDLDIAALQLKHGLRPGVATRRSCGHANPARAPIMTVRRDGTTSLPEAAGAWRTNVATLP